MKYRITYDKFTERYTAEQKVLWIFWTTWFVNPDNKFQLIGRSSTAVNYIYEFFSILGINKNEIDYKDKE